MSKRGIKCLIDTNILIGVEGPTQNQIIDAVFGEFSTLCQKHGVALYCHPASIDDINRDKNQDRKRSTLSRIGKYPILEKLPQISTEVLEKKFGGIHKPNDFVDCSLLYALSLNIVEFLVSEDEGVHKRARQTGLNQRVFSVREFINQVRLWFEPQHVSLPHVEDCPVHSLDFNDPIFTSLRGDYGFDGWIKDKCIPEGRRVWIVKDGGKLQALCIYNLESDAEREFVGLGAKSLKLCTFKVADEYRGGKIGELLLKEAFLYCVKNKYSSCYLTTKPSQQYLVEFLKDFGFQLHSKMKNGEAGPELVLFKAFGVPRDLPSMPPVDFHVLYWPRFYCGPETKKFVIPIRPEFHDVLFPEYSSQLSFGLPKSMKMAPGNTLKKAYLCGAKIKQIPSGSVVFFYRSKDRSEIVTVGVVEQTFRTKDFDEALRLIGKRSVYSIAEIGKMLSKETLIVVFRWVAHMNPGLGLKELLKLKVLNGQPQSILEIPHGRFVPLESKIHDFIQAPLT
jgi:predicted GNAT family N-acyltransferase